MNYDGISSIFFYVFILISYEIQNMIFFNTYFILEIIEMFIFCFCMNRQYKLTKHITNQQF